MTHFPNINHSLPLQAILGIATSIFQTFCSRSTQSPFISRPYQPSGGQPPGHRRANIPSSLFELKHSRFLTSQKVNISEPYTHCLTVDNQTPSKMKQQMPQHLIKPICTCSPQVIKLYNSFFIPYRENIVMPAGVCHLCKGKLRRSEDTDGEQAK